ncbi:ClpXP adapter SpxH family protein [Flavihumibacter stibioxidans]|uniref:Dithiol-disulfide isomerase n=1 Tax=Flavihumibacter stibioxidans TaxID=1834163 RepID=A0ABR7M980_9BACT|nr:ClpXP adapter SpxH family protein [Flavihumibacter stibioxidans]MBC6491290.1 dithiol-disulfide isomerase [Flavihumibacter stibioxidans]
MQVDNKYSMNCDMDTGICEIPQQSSKQTDELNNKPVKLLYFTDPICSSCWGIEPQLRKLKQEYGAYFDIEYRMGGLLKSWNEYGGSDVNGPESVAQHWEDASAYYNMPIDGDVWKEDPLHSSYPPAIAFKAAQLQGNQKADQFLRRIKEMVFTEKKNITHLEHLVQAANDAGLDTVQFEHDYKHKAEHFFQEDLFMAKEWGVRGFPTIYFIDGDDNRFKVYGSKPYQVYEEALLKLVPGKVIKQPASTYEDILKGYNTVTRKEFAIFYDKNLAEADAILLELEQNYKVKRMETKAGPLWKAGY